jgi:Tfp pilus assembly major pilin PilA
MNKKFKNQMGFTAVGGLLVILILAIIGAVGYMVYHNSNKTKSSSSSTTATQTSTATSTKITANSYAGWKTFILPVEKLSFKYPSSWDIEPKNTINPSTGQAWLSSQDAPLVITLGAPFGVSIIDGVSNMETGEVEDTSNVTTVKFLGETDYLVPFMNQSNSTEIDGGQLFTKPNNLQALPMDKTAVGLNVSDKYFQITYDLEAPTSPNSVDAKKAINDLKLIIQSMHY